MRFSSEHALSSVRAAVDATTSSRLRKMPIASDVTPTKIAVRDIFKPWSIAGVGRDHDRLGAEPEVEDLLDRHAQPTTGLPLLQAWKFALVGNYDIARMLGLTIPPSLDAAGDD